jgi:hypothetical protein
MLVPDRGDGAEHLAATRWRLDIAEPDLQVTLGQAQRLGDRQKGSSKSSL